MSGTSTPESPAAPPTLREGVHEHQLHRLHPLKHELRDARAARHGYGLTSEIDHRNHQLAAVVGVDRRGGVGERETVLDGEPRPGPYLGFEPGGNREGQDRKSTRLNSSH